ncbi:hypothetical protein BDV93DRAFT_427328, partial [Ceratobasidium sp. AG-I]
ESVVARNIVAVRHRPGVENRVCDALSRVYETRPDDNTAPGRDTSVDPGWEAAKGLVNDVCHLVNDDLTSRLLERFAGDLFFSDILLYLLFDTGSSDASATPDEIRTMRRRSHRAEGFMVEEGKLWLVRRQHSRISGKVECVPASETKALALAVHSAGGHFGRDMSVLALQQRFFWPTLRRDVTEAI